MKRKKREPFEPLPRSMFVISIVVLFLIVAIGVFFNGRTSADNNGSNITLSLPYEDIMVILDNRRVGSNNTVNEKLEFKNLQAGIHRVLISKEDYWPWGKVINLNENDTLNLTPFIVRIIPKLLPVPEMVDIEGVFQVNETYQYVTHQVRTNKNIVDSEDGLTQLTYDDSTLYVEWIGNESFLPHYFCLEDVCETKINILPTERHIVHADFYPNSNNIILFATDNSIFVIEIDRSGTQNVQPLYQGYKPTFTVIDDIIYILDEESLSQVILD